VCHEPRVGCRAGSQQLAAADPLQQGKGSVLRSFCLFFVFTIFLYPLLHLYALKYVVRNTRKKENLSRPLSIPSIRLFLSSREGKFLTCHGIQHRTGCAVASFRKVIGERSDDILEEYRAYSFPKSREWDERFIDSFDARTVTWLARLNGFAIKESDDVNVIPQYQCARI